MESVEVLRRPRPADKSLGDSPARSAPAEELGDSAGRQAIRRDRREQSEHSQALAQVDVRDLLSEARMPASGRPLVLLRLTLCEEQRELERLCQRDEVGL